FVTGRAVRASARADAPHNSPSIGPSTRIMNHARCCISPTSLAWPSMPHCLPADYTFHGTRSLSMATSVPTAEPLRPRMRAQPRRPCGLPAAGLGTRRARAGRAQPALGELLSCPSCVGTWAVAGLVYGLHLAPRPTRVFLTIMSAAGVAELLQWSNEA